ncbi:type VII secretion protein EccB [Crossiella cryophila]|uniref:Type VII secretion protein EccB n=1 Tax=Crossiella cryophila TaxID=43355 RepID=A0A7W7CCH4_9PSEU|nr:type VII secretion protein EccB [Crossiella cryophila]MBB4678584.1 type VII secretion protein EccB [Crossiella cryophila]
MQTRKDHVHAYQTLVGRMSAALLLGDTNYGEPPARRAVTGVIFGLVLGLLIGVAFWVYGLINPGGNTAWRKPGVILVEKESGARYVYQRGLLVPVLNHASAMLVQGQGSTVETITRASLAELDRGRPVGIPNAPDSVPGPGSLVTGSWLLCLPRTGGTEGGSLSMNLSPEAESTPIGEREYLWVAAASGEQYLVWGQQKLRLADATVAIALGLGAGTPPVAAAAWLAALPEGPPIGAATIPGAGGGGTSVGGVHRAVGTVFRHAVGNGAENLLVLRGDGLAPLSRTEVALLRARGGSAAVEVDAAAIAAAPRSADNSLTTRIPDLLMMKPITGGERAFCLRQETSGARIASQVVTAERRMAWTGMTEQTGAYLKPGTGLLAAAVPAPAKAGVKPDRYLITDRGFKYRLADDEAIQALGFGGITPRPVAAEVLAALPSGPVLSRAEVGVSQRGTG